MVATSVANGGMAWPSNDATIPAHRAAGDFSFGDEAAQIVLRGIGVQRDPRPVQHLEQFILSATKTSQKLIELLIAGAQREDPREAFVECGSKAGRGLSSDALECPVEPPDEIPYGLDLAGLPRRCRHQFLQQPLRVNPA